MPAHCTTARRARYGAAAAALLLLACDGAGAPPSTTAPSGTGTATAATAGPLRPNASAAAATWKRQIPAAPWLAELPATPDAPRKGEQAWAVLPLNETGQARVNLVRVDEAGDGGITVIDGIGYHHVGLPAALVHPLRVGEAPREGQLALCARWTTPCTVCRIEARAAGRVTRAAYDWAGVTKRGAIDHAEALPEALVPLAFASYPLEGRRARGQLVALGDAHGWVLGESGHVSKYPRHALRKLAVAGTVGQGSSVYAYRWGAGYQHGRVAEVLEAGLRFRVTLDGDRPDGDFFVSHLAIRPP